MHCGPLVVAVVPTLPRGAAVELHVMAVQDEPTERMFFQTSTRVPGATLSTQLTQAGNAHCATLSLAVSSVSLESDSTEPEPGVILRALGNAFMDSLKKLDRQLSPLCCRVFFKLSDAVGQQLATGRPNHSFSTTAFLIFSIPLLLCFQACGALSSPQSHLSSSAIELLIYICCFHAVEWN